jgi:hypothetical protein
MTDYAGIATGVRGRARRLASPMSLFDRQCRGAGGASSQRGFANHDVHRRVAAGGVARRIRASASARPAPEPR